MQKQIINSKPIKTAACNRGKRSLRQQTRTATTLENAKTRAPFDRIAR